MAASKRCFLPSRETANRGRSAFRWLLAKEVRELVTSRSYWLLLLVIGALVGHAFITSVNLYAEASGIGGGPSALAQGLSPLEGIVVPTLGAYDLAATLLFPFVVIRLFATEKDTGELALTLQAPARFATSVSAKAIALVMAWLLAGVAGAAALVIWRGMGGHLDAGEVATVALGHVLRGALTIGIGAAAAALAASAASAAIMALTFTLGTWALDYVAAARGGAVASIAAYTPSAALRVFERGELRLATIFVLIVVGVAGLAVASEWLQEGRRTSRRAAGAIGAVLVGAILCTVFGQLRATWDVSEDRRNSFPVADEAALRQIRQRLHVTVYLAAEDPRLADLERGVLAKLERTMPEVDVTYAATSRSGLFERPNERYGEVWYELGGKREMSRSTTEPIVLETIYGLAGLTPPTPVESRPYSGYPLARRSAAAPWCFFVVWPLAVAVAWWRGNSRRLRGRRTSSSMLHS
jgi:ABC-2 type transport system permease protein